MLNLLIAESRRNDVITKSFDLWRLYCGINSFLLIARELIEKEEKFMFVRRHFFEIDLEICRCHVFAWFFWSLMSRSECWLSWRNKKANDSIFSLRTRRCRMIWLFYWWLNHTNKRFWFVDEFHDVFVRKIFAKWS